MKARPAASARCAAAASTPPSCSQISFGCTAIASSTMAPTCSLRRNTSTIDIVDVFRRSEHVGAIVEEAIAVHPKLIWLQLGGVDAAAAQRAEAAGLAFIQDHCIAIEHSHLDR